MRGRHIAIAILIAVVALGAAAVWFIDWTRIDACLDAGGRWNRRTASCERD